MNQKQVNSEESREFMSVQHYINKHVYTVEGAYVGKVRELILSFEPNKISGIGLTNVNKDFFRNTHNVGKVKFPFSWVRSVSDIVVVRPISDDSLTL